MLSLPSTTGQNPGAGRFGLNVWRCPFILMIIVSNGRFALDFAHICTHLSAKKNESRCQVADQEIKSREAGARRQEEVVGTLERAITDARGRRV